MNHPHERVCIVVRVKYENETRVTIETVTPR